MYCDGGVPAIPGDYTPCLTVTIRFPRSRKGMLVEVHKCRDTSVIESSTKIMLTLKWLSVLALAIFAAAADVASTDVPELVIDKTYIPADCPVRSAKGDKIRVHYVGGVSSHTAANRH